MQKNNFLPAGTVEYLPEPAGPDTRVNIAHFTVMEITTEYDSMISKVIAWEKTVTMQFEDFNGHLLNKT